MSGKVTRSVSRRGFLKGAAAIGALGALGAGGMASTSGWLSKASADDSAPEKVAYLFHRTHCGNHCSLKCTVRDGRVCLIEPNDAYQDTQYRHLCVKGISEIQHIYSDQRVQSPMRRVGERGEGQFEAISWDEAYDILIENLQNTWDRYGRDAVLVHTSYEPAANYPFLAAMLGASVPGQGGIDNGLGNGLDQTFGSSIGCTDGPGENATVGSGYNALTNEPRDLVRSKYILAVGNNVFHTLLARSSMLLDAQEAGAKLVDVDPNYSQVAEKADEWVPIYPGTDAALYLGMASVIVNKRLYDEDFMKRRTDFPFLVNTQTGMRLREGEQPADKASDTGDEMVWDQASNSLVRQDQASDPALSGDRVINGVTYRAVFDLFTDYLNTFSVDDAARITHIPADKIEDMATSYATSGASAILTGYDGNDKMGNSDIAGHALAALVSLTGMIGKPGACVGTYADGTNGYTATLGTWTLPADMTETTMDLSFFQLPYEDNNIHMAILAGDVAMNSTADYRKTEEWMAGLDFVCAIDIVFASYTDYADLVLPAATPFESEDDFNGIDADAGYISIREKCIDPLFDSKTDLQIQLDIAERLGMRDVLPSSHEELMRRMLESSTDETIKGITLDTLVEHHGVQPQSCQGTIRRAYVNRFGTPSRRAELYYENMLPDNQQLPVWAPPIEIGEDNGLRDKYPLYFATYKSKYRIHNQFWDSAWNNQYESASIEMNGTDMESRGLSSGDEVRIFNDRGEFKTKVMHNEAVRPGCVRMPSGAWKKNVDEGCFQYVTNGELSERHSRLLVGYSIPYNDTLVEVEKA